MYSARRIVALKYLIFTQPQIPLLAKRVMSFLIDNSGQLTKDVCVTLTADDVNYSDGELLAAAVKGPSNYTYAILRAMGSRKHFSAHYGDYDESRGEKPLCCAGQFAWADPLYVGGNAEEVARLTLKGMPSRYTYWLASDSYSRKSARIDVTSRDLNEIVISSSSMMLDS